MPSSDATTTAELLKLPLDASGQPSGEAVYDMLMAQIEPELVSGVIDTLEAKYKDEAPEARTARGERYKAAFEKYEAAYAAFMQALEERVGKLQRDAMQSVEHEDRDRESKELQSLESSFGTA